MWQRCAAAWVVRACTCSLHDEVRTKGLADILRLTAGTARRRRRPASRVEVRVRPAGGGTGRRRRTILDPRDAPL